MPKLSMQCRQCIQLLLVAAVFALVLLNEGDCCVDKIKSTVVYVKKKVDTVIKKAKAIRDARKPKYIGCYTDKEDVRDIQFIGGRKSDMTVGRCESICVDDYPMTKYFGVQNGNVCFCGNDYGNYGVVRDGHCNKPCAGDKDQVCGGVLANSVFQKNAS